MLRLPAIIAALLLLFSDAAMAATRTVTSLADGPAVACGAVCRLRDALATATTGDTIVFDPALTAAATAEAPAVIGMTAGEFVVNKNLTIVGPGADLLVLDANSASRVLHVSVAGTNANVSGLTLRNGFVSAAGIGTTGGGVLVDAGTTLALTACTVRGNRAQALNAFNAPPGTGQAGQNGYLASGGGIHSAGTLIVRDSAILDNESHGGRGGNGGSGTTGGFLQNGGNGGMGGGGGQAVGAGLAGTQDTNLINVTIAGNAAYGGRGGDGGAGGMGGSGASNGNPGNGGNGGNATGAGSYTNAGTAGAEIAFSTFAAQVATPGVGGNGFISGPSGTFAGLSIYGSGVGGVVVRGSVIADAANACGGTYSAMSQNLQAGADCSGFTISGIDPRLGPIGWNGGQTPSFLPHHGSVVLDAAVDCGSAGGAVTGDQRGLARPSDGDGDGNVVCDLGAVESDRIFDDDFEG